MFWLSGLTNLPRGGIQTVRYLHTMAIEQAFLLKEKDLRMKAAQAGRDFSQLLLAGKHVEADASLEAVRNHLNTADAVAQLGIEVKMRLQELSGDLPLTRYQELLNIQPEAATLGVTHPPEPTPPQKETPPDKKIIDLAPRQEKVAKALFALNEDRSDLAHPTITAVAETAYADILEPITDPKQQHLRLKTLEGRATTLSGVIIEKMRQAEIKPEKYPNTVKFIQWVYSQPEYALASLHELSLLIHHKIQLQDLKNYGVKIDEAGKTAEGTPSPIFEATVKAAGEAGTTPEAGETTPIAQIDREELLLLLTRNGLSEVIPFQRRKKANVLFELASTFTAMAGETVPTAMLDELLRKHGSKSPVSVMIPALRSKIGDVDKKLIEKSPEGDWYRFNAVAAGDTDVAEHQPTTADVDIRAVMSREGASPLLISGVDHPVFTAEGDTDTVHDTTPHPAPVETSAGKESEPIDYTLTESEQVLLARRLYTLSAEAAGDLGITLQQADRQALETIINNQTASGLEKTDEASISSSLGKKLEAFREHAAEVFMANEGEDLTSAQTLLGIVSEISPEEQAAMLRGLEVDENTP